MNTQKNTNRRFLKTLYVMTHPSKETGSNEDDFFVPLTQIGIKEAQNIANQLKEKDVELDLIVSSPSLRTETTSMIVSQALNIKKTILYNEVLYQGFTEELIESINFTFYSVETLLIVGHSPLLSNLANHFVGYKEKLKEGIVLHIIFDTNSWVDISEYNAKLIDIIEPK